jgi:hypothetical protein
MYLTLRRVLEGDEQRPLGVDRECVGDGPCQPQTIEPRRAHAGAAADPGDRSGPTIDGREFLGEDGCEHVVLRDDDQLLRASQTRKRSLHGSRRSRHDLREGAFRYLVAASCSPSERPREPRMV